MDTIITPEKIELPPGAVLKLLGDWQDYQVLSQQLGDRSFPRIKYRCGEILLMAPLPEHGRDASLLAQDLWDSLSVEDIPLSEWQ